MSNFFCSKTPFPINSCASHFHPCWEMIYQLSGENTSVIGTGEYKISPGDVMIIPPNVFHSGKSNGVYTDIYIQAPSLDFFDVNVICDRDGSILSLFNMFHKAFLQKENNHKMICQSLLEAICQYIKKYSEQKYRFDFVYDLKNIIYENLSNPEFKISSLAEISGYNTDYLRRCFFAETGTNPREYLSSLRLSQAKKLLLRESFTSIEDVALKCGFNDSFYFSTLFKKSFGISPSEYRKRELK